MLTQLQALKFDNTFSQDLPADPSTENRPRQVHSACYSWVKPQSLNHPKYIACSHDAAELIGLDTASLKKDVNAQKQFCDVFTGQTPLEGMQSYAMAYGGHQFGQWAGQLGDGRAINLGEVLHNHQHWSLQLKGAGPTPYSRTADGLAVLRSSVREFLCSEAMHYLGVPTTRALSLCLTGDQVMRDMFYDGHAQLEPGAIVCRMAPSFIRFGNFELFSARGDIDNLRHLVHHTLKHHFPDYHQALEATPEREATILCDWFRHICLSTADMINHWMRVGFVHGVMNTDNMSILGLTIDYGPYGWLEDYDPHWTPNTTDAQGRRYSYGQQPQMGQWNCFKLANALFSLINDATALESILGEYARHYETQWKETQAAKLGLETFQDSDEQLYQALESIWQETTTDMTLFYRALGYFDPSELLNLTAIPERIMQAFYQPEEALQLQDTVCHWLNTYAERCQKDSWSHHLRKAKMNSTNPKYVLRNYLAQQAIEKAENGHYAEIETLLEILKNPYEEQPEYEHYASKRPQWAQNKPGCSTLSCSS